MHYYPCWSFSAFLDAAWDSFSSCAAKVAPGEDFIPVMCLLETIGSNWFELLVDPELKMQLSGWRIDRSFMAGGLLRVYGDTGQNMFILPGRQLVSNENIEVLVVGSAKPTEITSARGYLEQYANIFPVILPWGVGKWLGERGKVVDGLIREVAQYPFYLGDNSGRPNFWSGVPQFALANEKSVPILPGSDPLPVIGQYKKTASYGFVLRGRGAVDNMLQSPLEVLRNLACPVEAYGNLDRLGNFLYSQVRMRLQPLKLQDFTV